MTRRKRKQENVLCSEEMFRETCSLCEDYAGAMNRLKENQKRLEEYCGKRKHAKSETEKIAYDQEIAWLQTQLQKDDENTSYFRWALAHLDKREQTVLTQLYTEGYTWDSVQSETGEKMTVGAVDKARKRGIRRMALLITEMKKCLAESSPSSAQNLEEQNP